MTLTPFEVERREFGRSPWGYKAQEVDTFLSEVRGALAELWEERATLREENERLDERVARFTALEEQLKNTLLLAQESAEKACEQARREAELVLREASQKAREIVNSAHQERQGLEGTLRDLQVAEQESRQRFRALASTVLTHLDESEERTGAGVGNLRAAVRAQSGNTGGQAAVIVPVVKSTEAVSDPLQSIEQATQTFDAVSESFELRGDIHGDDLRTGSDKPIVVEPTESRDARSDRNTQRTREERERDAERRRRERETSGTAPTA